MIAYLRVVPGFWIALEEHRRPEICSHPVIMGSSGGTDSRPERRIVREANFLAQRSGVRSGMTLSQAHHHCPDGVFLFPDLPFYGAIWEKVCDILQMYTPLVEPIEMGQAACDLSGCERLWGNAPNAARAIVSQIQQTVGITPWFGIASNRLVAELASTRVDASGITVVDEGREAVFLADLPIALLPGVDERLAITFRVLGLKTIGQLAALPVSAVRQRFGSDGEKLHVFARGIDPRPVIPPPARPSVTARYQCEDSSLQEAVAAIHQLAETCAAELQHRRLAGRLVEIAIYQPLPPEMAGKNSAPVEANRKQSNQRTSRVIPSPPHRASLPSSPSAIAGSRLDGMGDDGASEGTHEAFPISYRIHSMLPQPESHRGGIQAAARGDENVSREIDNGQGRKPSTTALVPLSDPLIPAHLGAGYARRTKTAVRIPIATAPPLVEQAQRLLMKIWPQTGEIEAIVLEVSEFEEPAQLSFAEFNRLDQVGTLGGMSAGRMQILTQQEQILVARYGEAFRHVTHMDPGNILAERRFRWQPGLRRQSGSDKSRKKGRRRS